MDELYARARRQVDARIGFYVHLAVFVIVNGLLAYINLTRSPQHLWFLWPFEGWGVAVFLHFFAVFVVAGPPSLRQRMIERTVHRERAKHKPCGA